MFCGNANRLQQTNPTVAFFCHLAELGLEDTGAWYNCLNVKLFLRCYEGTRGRGSIAPLIINLDTMGSVAK
jgi:hypothetical protein